jgi:hypothetical protein
MPSFDITARKTSPLTSVTVEANTREEAVAQIVAQAAEGEQIEVLQCIEALPDAGAPPPGATGATGATGPASRKKD